METWLATFRPRIETTAQHYAQFQTVKRAQITAPEIADHVIDTLRWKLETFDPNKKVIGADNNEKIDRYCKWHISAALKEIVKTARRKPRFTQPPEGHAERKADFFSITEGKPTQERPDATQIIEALTKNGFKRTQIVIMLAHLAGMTQKQIGLELGVSQKYASLTLDPVKKKFGITQRLRVRGKRL